MRITLADFVELLPFSSNIEARQLNAFITQAQQLDLLPLLGHETMEGLTALPAAVLLPVDTVPGQILAGDLFARRERVYRALVAATAAPIPVLSTDSYTVSLSPGHLRNPPAEGDWQYERALTLWSQYVRPYWVQRAFSRFLTTHGLNITKAGITVPIDRASGTYDRPNAGQVATLQAAVDTTAEALLSRLTRFLRYEGLLWFIDPQTGHGAYSFDGCNAIPGDYTGLPGRVGTGTTTRRHRRPVRGINR